MSSFPSALHIGPVCFRFLQQEVIVYSAWAYRDFWKPVDSVYRPTTTLPVELYAGAIDVPDREPDYAAGDHWYFYDRLDKGLLFVYRPTSLGERTFCQVDRDLSACRLYVEGDISDAPLRYPLDQILTWGMLGKCGGVLLHAAGVEHDGVGYVLAGRSGAGKSTLSGFCHEAGWDILNDDRVIVHPDPVTGQWFLSGTPWHGTGRFAKNRTVPLGGVYLLQQDKENIAEEIALQEARYALMDVAGIAWFEEVWSQQALDAIARLTQEVPVRRLRFTRSADAVEALKG